MGVRDDGKPDRRHIERKTRAEATRAVRELEKQRDSGRMRKAGRAWIVEQWLIHWLDNIAAHSVRYKTLVGYRTDVTRRLTQGGAQGPVDVVHCASGQTRADHPSVKLLDVLGFELIDPVCS